MRIKHQSSAHQVLGATPRNLRLEGALRVQARQAGWLWVEGGTAGLTRGGDAVDQVLARNGSVYLGRGEQLVAEPWRSGEVVNLRWTLAADARVLGDLRPPNSALSAQPARGASAALTGAAWDRLAGALRGGASLLASAARWADAMARRAQGRINAGDSMASSCARQ